MGAATDTGEWEREVDVLIAGSGAGGMVGAIAAHDRGLTTLVVEKAHGFGGSTAMSGGGIWIPNNPTLRRKGLACPADVSLVGFEDIRYARHLDPPLTTVSLPKEAIGHEVVRLLLDVLAGRADTVRHVTLAHRLVGRASTAPAATLAR